MAYYSSYTSQSKTTIRLLVWVWQHYVFNIFNVIIVICFSNHVARLTRVIFYPQIRLKMFGYLAFHNKFILLYFNFYNLLLLKTTLMCIQILWLCVYFTFMYCHLFLSLDQNLVIHPKGGWWRMLGALFHSV